MRTKIFFVNNTAEKLQRIQLRSNAVSQNKFQSYFLH